MMRNMKQIHKVRTLALFITCAGLVFGLGGPLGPALIAQPQTPDQAVVLVQPLEPRRGHGTGFIISSDGYLLTNAHVICDSTKILIRLDDGTEREAAVAVLDLAHDLALLKIDARGLPTMPLGDSKRILLGEKIKVIGFPQRFQQTKVITEGVVSQKGVSTSFTLCERSALERTIQLKDLLLTTAPTEGGNSGGPMLSQAGEVIGVVNGRIGFVGAALPVETTKQRICSMRTAGSWPLSRIPPSKRVTSCSLPRLGSNRGSMCTSMSSRSFRRLGGKRFADEQTQTLKRADTAPVVYKAASAASLRDTLHAARGSD